MSSLKQIEEDLKAFHDFCIEQNLTREEIAKICAPLCPSSLPKPRKILLILLAVLSCYYLAQLDSIAWHLSAIGRIILVKILPIYDWQTWKNEKCLLKASPKSSRIETNDCYYCESLTEVAFSRIATGDHLKETYLDLDVPVVFSHPSRKFNTTDDFLQGILRDFDYADSDPCKIATNLRSKRTVGELLSQTSPSYFLHYQNCDFAAVKSFRKFLQRPEFFPADAAPVQYSWLILSRNYHVERFRKVKLQEALIAFVQLFGGNVVRLRAAGGCDGEVCERLEVAVQEGDVVLFGAGWDLEYRPGVGEEGENVAVILETH